MENKKKILIVEDNPQQLLVIFDTLAKAGFLVRRASSGDEGFQLAVNTKPDLIIVDKMMPNTNGLMMMNMVREQGDWGKNVPILVFSNVALRDEEKSMIGSLEPGEYLSKSDISLEMLVQKVKEYLAKQKPSLAEAV